MPKSSKKGRLTGAQRKEINSKAVSEALDEPEGVIFARVVKHLGMGNLQVVLTSQKVGIAKIRTVLSRRGATPITSDDIVILSQRDFESEADKRMRFDVLGVLSRSEASKLEKGGHIPKWFMQIGTDAIGDRPATDEYEFDYTDVKEEGADSDSDDDVDIDDI